MKPFAEHRLDVQVNDDQVFFELLPARDQIPVLIKNETVAVKHQFVLTAYKIVICNDDCVVRCTRRKHSLPPAAFPGLIRR